VLGRRVAELEAENAALRPSATGSTPTWCDYGRPTCRGEERRGEERRGEERRGEDAARLIHNSLTVTPP
jgi:hypothetical protein